MNHSITRVPAVSEQCLCCLQSGGSEVFHSDSNSLTTCITASLVSLLLVNRVFIDSSPSLLLALLVAVSCSIQTVIHAQHKIMVLLALLLLVLVNGVFIDNCPPVSLTEWWQ